MAQVRYGADGQAFPVQVGETWECGAHTFRCGGLFDWQPPLHNLVYCDPPWNNAMVRAFHTKAGLAAPAFDYLAIYRGVIGHAGGNVPVWLEGGKREAASIEALLPGPVRRTFPITYYRTKPAVLMYSGPAQLPPSLALALPGMDDEHTPDAVLRAYGTGVVIDPCAGRGLTSRAAEIAGWRSDSNELNPLRVSAALARMHRLNGHEPRRIA